MFCPECRAEYRPGFTRCSDCDVALVERLDDRAVHSNNPELSDKPELLWTGTDAQIQGAIVNALENAGITYHERRDKVGVLRNWSQEVYAIFTHARDHHAASAALEEVTHHRESAPEDADDEPDNSDSSLQAQTAGVEDDEDDLSEVPPDYVPDDFDPDEATAEVWSGQNATIRENLVTFLNNIGIGAVTDEFAGLLSIRVTPESQKRAQEMIRQVMEAS
jgi:hypothetical protein